MRQLSKFVPTHTARQRITGLLVAALFLAGFGLRLIDLTEPPLDFHPARQLRAAVIARGMFYQMQPSAQTGWLGAQSWIGAAPLETSLERQETAIALWHSMVIYEPQIFERLVALTYLLLGAEVLWVARLYAISFWLLGGWALFELARRAASLEGGLLALAVYLIAPLGVNGSRSFQPEALMVCLTLWAAYSATRWSDTHAWRWAIWTGLLAGLAVLIKAPAVFIIAPLLLFLVLSTWGFADALRRPQVWLTALLAITLGGGFYLYKLIFQASSYLDFWSGSFRALLFDPGFYIRWLVFIDRNVLPVVLVFASLAGMALFDSRGRAVAAGLWVGYAAIGLTVPYLITTHDYYSLPLIPAAAFSLAPFAQPIYERVRRQPAAWRVAFSLVVILALAFPAWITRSALVGKDYRPEISGWQKMGREIPTDGRIIALTHDYGHRLHYYGWVAADLWPATADQEMNMLRGGNEASFSDEFARRTQGYAYFLVTLLKDFEAQPQLAKRLREDYPLLAEGNGYLLFDLR